MKTKESIAPAKIWGSTGIMAAIVAASLMGTSAAARQEKTNGETLTWATMGGLVSMPKPNASPHFKGTNLPAPPRQLEPWTPPRTESPSNFVAAARAIFDAGLPDPRGCEYREVEVPTGNVWTGDSGLVKTHGWVFKHHEATFAVCWNGLVYPVAQAGPLAVLADDVRTMGSNAVSRFNEAMPDAATVSHGLPLPFRGCFLLRLGEGRLADEFWAAPQIRAQQGQSAIAGAAKTNSLRVLLEVNKADPYLSWASDWAWSMFDRALTAHMRGDDGLALASARELERVRPLIESEAERRQFGRPHGFMNGPNGSDAPLPYLHFTASALLQDQERRARERASGYDLRKAEAITNQSERIATLVRRLDQTAIRQWGQPGGLRNWSQDANVYGIISEGHDAIEPLLHSLETDADQRLTRSVSFGRDFHRNRAVHSTYGAVIEALHAILRTTSFGAWATPEEIAAAGTNNNRITAAHIRAYWKKFGTLSIEERWYRTLQDDKAVEGAWRDAIVNILAPVNSRPAHIPLPTMRITEGPIPMRGEPLRDWKNPTVSELMIKRYTQRATPVPPATEINEFDLNDDLKQIARWDRTAALPLMKRMMETALELWKTAGSKPLRSDEWNALNGSRGPAAAKCIMVTTSERAQAGDAAALEQYAGWLRTLSPDHYDNWQAQPPSQHDPFEPMLRFPTNAVITTLAEFIFNDPRSMFSSRAAVTNGMNSFVMKYCGTELSLLPAFQRRLIEALADKTEAGTYTLQNDNYVSFSDAGNTTTYLVASPDEQKSVRGQPVKFRICDHVVSGLSRWAGMPTTEKYWHERARDEAVAACREQLLKQGARLMDRERK